MRRMKKNKKNFLFIHVSSSPSFKSSFMYQMMRSSFIILSLLLSVSLSQVIDSKSSDGRTEDLWYLEQSVPWPPVPYAFGYEVRDPYGNEQYRKESSDGRQVTGSYGYWGPDGIYRHVDYIADHNGYRANIRTSEPGTANENPAAVRLQSVTAPAYNPGPTNPFPPASAFPAPPYPAEPPSPPTTQRFGFSPPDTPTKGGGTGAERDSGVPRSGPRPSSAGSDGGGYGRKGNPTVQQTYQQTDFKKRVSPPQHQPPYQQDITSSPKGQQHPSQHPVQQTTQGGYPPPPSRGGYDTPGRRRGSDVSIQGSKGYPDDVQQQQQHFAGRLLEREGSNSGGGSGGKTSPRKPRVKVVISSVPKNSNGQPDLQQMYELIQRVNTHDKLRNLQQASYEQRSGRNIVAGVNYLNDINSSNNNRRNAGMIEVPMSNSPAGIVHSDRRNNYTTPPTIIYGERIHVGDAPPGAGPPPPAPRPSYPPAAPHNTQLPHSGSNLRVPMPTALPINREFRRSDFPTESPPENRNRHIQVGIHYPQTDTRGALRSPLIPTSLPAPPPPVPRPTITAPVYPSILPPPPINIELKRSGKLTFDDPRSDTIPVSTRNTKSSQENNGENGANENTVAPTPKPSSRTVVYYRPDTIQHAQHIFHPDPKKPEEINDRNNRIPVSTRGFTILYPKPISYQYSHQVIHLMPRKMDGQKDNHQDGNDQNSNSHPHPSEYERRVEGGEADGPEFSYTDIPIRNSDPIEDNNPNDHNNYNNNRNNNLNEDKNYYNDELNYGPPVTESNNITIDHENRIPYHEVESELSREEEEELYRSSTSPQTASPDYNSASTPHSVSTRFPDVNSYPFETTTPVPSTTTSSPFIPTSTYSYSNEDSDEDSVNPVQESLAPNLYPTPAPVGIIRELPKSPAPPDISSKVYEEIRRAEGDPGYTHDPSNLVLEGLRKKAHDEDSAIHGSDGLGSGKQIVSPETFPFGDEASSSLETGDTSSVNPLDDGDDTHWK